MRQRQPIRKYWTESPDRPKPKPTIILACAEVDPVIRGVYIGTNKIRFRYTRGINTCHRRRHCYTRHYRHRKTREGVDGARGAAGAARAGMGEGEEGVWDHHIHSRFSSSLWIAQDIRAAQYETGLVSLASPGSLQFVYQSNLFADVSQLFCMV